VSEPPTSFRSGPAWLFCPADRPERYSKASAAADVVILDLEDGVAPADKAAARSALLATPLDPSRTVVRINSADSADHDLDLAALAAAGYTTVMLSKTESPAQITALAAFRIVALVETPRGVLNAGELAAASNVVGLMWGAEDLVAGLGGRSSRTAAGAYRDVARHARSTVLIAAASFGRFALDAVHIDIADLDGLAAEAADAAAIGFAATACIHPRQVEVVRKAYRPSADEAGWAERVLAAARAERGVFAFEGSMVDAPLLRHAEAIIARSGSRGG
jgi:citrate lyase subunit beta/citryl-CoA lyase